MNSQFSSKKQRGLTLVELLIGMTILSVVTGLALSVLLNVQKTQRKFDEKYACSDEADRIARDVENSLRLAQKLIAGTDNKIKFLDINNDTTEYYLKADTLFKNKISITSLSVDSLYFSYIKIEGNKKMSDFYLLDINRDDILDALELNDVSGIRVYMKFSYSRVQGSKSISIGKQFFTLLRNLRG